MPALGGLGAGTPRDASRLARRGIYRARGRRVQHPVRPRPLASRDRRHAGRRGSRKARAGRWDRGGASDCRRRARRRPGRPLDAPRDGRGTAGLFGAQPPARARTGFDASNILLFTIDPALNGYDERAGTQSVRGGARAAGRHPGSPLGLALQPRADLRRGLRGHCHAARSGPAAPGHGRARVLRRASDVAAGDRRPLPPHDGHPDAERAHVLPGRLGAGAVGGDRQRDARAAAVRRHQRGRPAVQAGCGPEGAR